MEKRPSTADIWMNCPGSIKMCHDNSLQDSGPTDATREGTKLHEAMEKIFKGDKSPLEDETLSVEQRDSLEWSASKLKYFTNDAGTPILLSYSETSFTFSNDSISLQGTPDVVLLYEKNESGETLVRVIDFKFGNLQIFPDSWQLKLYVLLVFNSLKRFCEKNKFKVEAVVIQPKTSSVISKVFCYKDIAEIEKALMKTHNNLTITPGTHCRFCPAKMGCPKAKEVLKTGLTSIANYRLSTQGDMVKVLKNKKIILQMIECMETAIEQALKKGEKIEGAHLVPKRPRRMFNSSEISRHEMKPLVERESELYEVKLKSPTKLMKLNKEMKDYILKNSSMISSGDKLGFEKPPTRLTADFINLLTKEEI